MFGKGTRPVQRQLFKANCERNAWARCRAGLVAGLLADISIAAKDARIIDGHTRLGVAAGDCRHRLAYMWDGQAKYYLLLCDQYRVKKRNALGLSLCASIRVNWETAVKTAQKLARGAPSAIRFTKYAMNNWLRMMGPTFDTSLALEFLGFTGPEAKKGLPARETPSSI